MTPVTASRTKRWLIGTLVTGVAIGVALNFAPPCLIRLNPDPGALRPRTYPIMNPLRDRAPEHLAEQYLRQLAAGRSAELRPYFGANRGVMIEREPQRPPISWRIADRRDEGQTTYISYWVKRANGWPGEEDAMFELHRTSEWRLVSYNAIY